MLDLAMANARRLVEAAAGFHHHFSDAFVFEQHPALEHVHELHVDIVVVPLAVRRLAPTRTDDVRRAPSLKIMEELFLNGAKIKAFDPVASANAKEAARVPFDVCESAMDAPKPNLPSTNVCW